MRDGEWETGNGGRPLLLQFPLNWICDVHHQKGKKGNGRLIVRHSVMFLSRNADVGSNATLIFGLQYGALSLGKQQKAKCVFPPQEAH
jgi:hypothetical protein